MENIAISALEALRALDSLQNLVELVDETDIEDQRRLWVRPTNANRQVFGASEQLVQEMRLYEDDEFFNFTRLTIDQFDDLLILVGPLIKKKHTRQDVISPYIRLLITLRYSMLLIQFYYIK